MERKPVDVATVLADSLQAIAAPCMAQRVSLTHELAPGPWNVSGDATRLRQSFDNLLRNALEAQPEGGTIHVTAQKDDAELVLRFADAGPGVPPERQEELFQFGNTTKSGGSGIGLPLSQLVAEAHGGSLAYEEREGGAVFRVKLPLEVN
jgi:signal transduction histidine kinase